MSDKDRQKITRAELKELQDRVRKQNGDNPPDRSRRRRATSGFSFPTWMIHLVMGVIVLAGVMVLLSRGQKPPVIPPKNLPFEKATIIGEGAIVPIGSVEVLGSEYANVTGLGPGSDLALKTQKSSHVDKRLPLEIENSIGMRFRMIPAGTFIMGSPDDEVGRGPDETQDGVTYIPNAFYMGKYEVTQAQFETIMKYNPSKPKKVRKPQQPVQDLTWMEARDFCRRLCQREELPKGTYRMPLEREWEFACRAMTKTPYHWGEDPDRYFEFAVIKANGPEEVGLRRPNAWGLHNMHGNVWEWCQNKFYLYTTKQSDRNYPAIRGGSWRVTLDRARSAKRMRLGPKSRGNFLGFRVLRIVTPKTCRIIKPEQGNPDLAPTGTDSVPQAKVVVPSPEKE
jgi:formylglycine-generating enzyme required for sulfatase activity